MRIFIHALADEFEHNLTFVLKLRALRIECIVIGEGLDDRFVPIEDGLFITYNAVESIHEGPFQIILIQVRRPTFIIVLEFLIALPDRAPVLAGAVPHLGTVDPATLTAYDFAREAAYTAGVADALTPFHLVLNYIEHLRGNDRRVAIFNIVLGNLAFVDLMLFSQKINGVLLLSNDSMFDTNARLPLLSCQGNGYRVRVSTNVQEYDYALKYTTYS